MMLHRKHWRKSVYQSTSLIAVVLLLLIMFTSAAWFIMFPGAPDTSSTPGFEQKLRLNLARWDEKQPASYRYVVRRSCSCPAEDTRAYVATETRGQRTAEFPVTVESSAGEFLTEPPDPAWISDIFNELRQAARHARDIDATFNERYGYPESATIHYGTADSETRYEVRDFEVLEYQ
ncbi:MAG: DUF6174 domain-containing protein [Woeseiaceae bacterium]